MERSRSSNMRLLLGAPPIFVFIFLWAVYFPSIHGIIWSNEGGDANHEPENAPPLSVLGDSIISQKATDSMFLMLDGNDNGGVTAEEIRAFVRNTGGSDLDELGEIGSATASVMHSMDDNADEIVRRKDLGDFLVRQASLLNVDEVALWATHSMHMPPDVVQAFVDHGVTGFDFPELIENNGELIESELGVSRRNLKKRLLRGMIMRFTGMGKLPPAPTNLAVIQSGCNQIQVRWDRVGNSGFPVHKYLLQRLQLDSAQTGVVSSKNNKWETIYEDTGDHFTDSFSVGSTSSSYTIGALYRTYRLSAWNVIGRSDYVTVYYFLPPFETNCHKSISPASVPPEEALNQDISNSTSPTLPFEELESVALSISVGILVALLAYLFTQSPQKTASAINNAAITNKEAKKKASSSIALVVKLKSMFYRRRKRRQAADILKTDSEVSADVSGGQLSHDDNGEPMSPMTDLSMEDLAYSMNPGSPSDHSLILTNPVFFDSSLASDNASLPPLPPKKRSKWKVLKEHIRNGTLIDAVTKPRSRTRSNASNGSNSSSRNENYNDGSPHESPSDSSVSKFILPPSPIRFIKSKSGVSDTNLSQGASAVPDTKNAPTRSYSAGASLDQLVITSGVQGKATSYVVSADDIDANANKSRTAKISLSPRKLRDGTHCRHCGRSYSFLLKKHQCGRCHVDFCHDCSFSTPHSSLLPCKVPSLCICKGCGK